MPIDHHPPGGRAHDATDDADERGLARAIGPEQGEDLTAADGEVDLLQRREARGVLFRQPADLDDAFHGRQDNLAGGPPGIRPRRARSAGIGLRNGTGAPGLGVLRQPTHVGCQQTPDNDRCSRHCPPTPRHHSPQPSFRNPSHLRRNPSDTCGVDARQRIGVSSHKLTLSRLQGEQKCPGYARRVAKPRRRDIAIEAACSRLHGQISTEPLARRPSDVGQQPAARDDAAAKHDALA